MALAIVCRILFDSLDFFHGRNDSKTNCDQDSPVAEMDSEAFIKESMKTVDILKRNISKSKNPR